MILQSHSKSKPVVKHPRLENRDHVLELLFPPVYPALESGLFSALVQACHRTVEIAEINEARLVVRCKPEDCERVQIVVNSFQIAIKYHEDMLS